MKRTLVPYTTRGSVWDFMSEMEKTFDDLWGTANSPKEAPVKAFTPPVDVHEVKEGYLMTIDLPGLTEKDVKIDLQNGRLVVHGERQSVSKFKEAGFRRLERSFGRFERSFQLPQDVREDQIQAGFENGVLEILIPRVEASKPRSIEINAGSKSLFPGSEEKH